VARPTGSGATSNAGGSGGVHHGHDGHRGVSNSSSSNGTNRNSDNSGANQNPRAIPAITAELGLVNVDLQRQRKRRFDQ
jgi:hypothetical protein